MFHKKIIIVDSYVPLIIGLFNQINGNEIYFISEKNYSFNEEERRLINSYKKNNIYFHRHKIINYLILYLYVLIASLSNKSSLYIGDIGNLHYRYIYKLNFFFRRKYVLEDGTSTFEYCKFGVEYYNNMLNKHNIVVKLLLKLKPFKIISINEKKHPLITNVELLPIKSKRVIENKSAIIVGSILSDDYFMPILMKIIDHAEKINNKIYFKPHPLKEITKSVRELINIKNIEILPKYCLEIYLIESKKMPKNYYYLIPSSLIYSIKCIEKNVKHHILKSNNELPEEYKIIYDEVTKNINNDLDVEFI